MSTSPRIVLLGGGTGSFTLLQGLKQLTPHLTSIVNMSDDGGSTGVLRDELGVLPPGDLRQCLVALSDMPELRDLFSYRFSKGRLKGQSLGNIILSGLELQYDNIEDAVRIAGKILHIQGKVLPVTTHKHTLMMKDGWRTVKGQARISNYRIKNADPQLWLKPAAHINPHAEAAILKADMVVIAPGIFYASLLPIFSVEGVAAALRNTSARVVYITNLVNKPGQTSDWHVADYVQCLEGYIGEGTVDIVLYNKQSIPEDLLKRYAAKGEHPVGVEVGGFAETSAQLVGARLVAKELAEQDPADVAIRRTLIRHDPVRVCAELEKLLKR